MRLLLLGNLDNRRIKLQVLAAKEIGLPPPTLISWASLLSRWTFTEVAEKAASCDLLRIDSPGECWQIDKLLIERGATIQDLKVHLKEEKGRIQYLESYGIGLLTSIQEAQQTAEKTGIRSVYSATALQRMVDKVINEITGKLNELDLSLDYIAAALLDTGELSIAARQKGVTRGRGAQIARWSFRSQEENFDQIHYPPNIQPRRWCGRTR